MNTVWIQIGAESAILVQCLNWLGAYMGDRLRGAKWGNKPEPWNHTASSTGTLVSCAWEYRSHQLARPVGIPYAGSSRGALVQLLPMPQLQLRRYLPGGSSRQCSSSATCHSTSMFNKYSRDSADSGIRKIG